MVFALFVTLSAQSYNENILKIEANIIPRIVLMDYKFTDKLHDKHIRVLLLHNGMDAISALKMQNIMEEKYPDGIKGYALDIRLQTYDAFLAHPQPATVYYLMDTHTSTIKDVVAIARKQGVLTFSHDTKNLALGANVSLKIDKKIIPYINVTSLKESGISLRPALLSISEIYQ